MQNSYIDAELSTMPAVAVNLVYNFACVTDKSAKNMQGYCKVCKIA